MKQSLLTRIMYEFGDKGHSIFAPSGSAMWLHCSGGLIANLFEEDNGSPEAAEGTVAHELAEQWLKTGEKPRHRIGEIVKISERSGSPVYEIEIDEVMLDHVSDYVDWCSFEEGDHFVEQKVYFTKLMPRANPDEPDESPVPFLPQGGTADHVVCRPGVMTITDLKYGKGVKVFAENNPQAMLYALGFFYEWDWLYDFQEIIIRIAQPRLDSFETWEISRDDLLKFADFVKVRAEKAWDLKAPRKASPTTCQWCKVKSRCTAAAVSMENVAYKEISEFDLEVDYDVMKMMKERLSWEYKINMSEVSILTIAEMLTLLEYRKPIENWFRSIAESLEEIAMSGEAIPGYKLVESRSNRQFRDEGKAADHLRFIGLTDKDLYKVTMASPVQAEELLRKVAKIDRALIEPLMSDYVFRPAGRPTLVKNSDKRPPIMEQYHDVWDD